jgi:hypothetical protein
VGTAVGVLSMHYAEMSHFGPWGPRRFLTVPLTTLFGFGLLVGVGLVYRRKPAIHRPLMLLGTVFAGAAAYARIQAFTQPFAAMSHNGLGVTIWGPPLTVALLLLLLKMVMTRRWDRVYAAGFAALLAISVISAAVSATGWWDSLAAVIIRR